MAKGDPNCLVRIVGVFACLKKKRRASGSGSQSTSASTAGSGRVRGSPPTALEMTPVVASSSTPSSSARPPVQVSPAQDSASVDTASVNTQGSAGTASSPAAGKKKKEEEEEKPKAPLTQEEQQRLDMKRLAREDMRLERAIGDVSSNDREKLIQLHTDQLEVQQKLDAFLREDVATMNAPQQLVVGETLRKLCKEAFIPYEGIEQLGALKKEVEKKAEAYSDKVKKHEETLAAMLKE